MANGENQKSYLHMITENLHREIKIHCIETDQSMKAFYDTAVENELAEQKIK